MLQGRAGERAVALMQRARSSGGQVAVSTQSVSDVPSATANEHLLASLSDNFAGFVLHRQTSPESRDWLSKLLGTRELWQSTDQTVGSRAGGIGTRRRARRVHRATRRVPPTQARRGGHLERARTRARNASPSPPPRRHDSPLPTRSTGR